MRPISLLEQRRLRESLAGLPTYDDAGNVSGYVPHQVPINMDDLPGGDQEALGRVIIETLQERDARVAVGQSVMSEERTYAAVLEMHGIKCPHPAPMRAALGGRMSGYECKACGCWVIPTTQ